MKVLVVVHGFPPSAQGGAEIYAHAHASALRQAGDDVLVLTRDQDPARPEYDVRAETTDRLRIVRVNNTFRNTRTFADTYRNDAIGAIASHVIDEFTPDVAHIHHLTCLSTTIVRSLAERRIPRFMTLHDYWLLCHRGQLLDLDCRVCDGPDGDGTPNCDRCLGFAGRAGSAGFAGAAALRALERQLPSGPAGQLRRMATTLATAAVGSGESDGEARERIAHMRRVCDEMTLFLAPSNQMRDRFIRFGIGNERIVLSPYGFDRSPFQSSTSRARDDSTRAPSEANPLRVGFLGSLMISKAPDVLLAAVRDLPAGAASVHLFGTPVAYHGDDRYRTQIDELARQDNVELHGPVEHARIAEAFRAIDVLAVPSIWPENSPLVIQEAFLAGVPVVASRIGGIPEVVTDGVNGLLFQPGDSADLARCLLRLRNEPGLLDRLRAGIPPVRTIEDDVQAARVLYKAHRRLAVVRSRIAAVVLNYRTPHQTLLAVRSLLASRTITDLIVVDNDGAGDGDGLEIALRDVAARITVMRTNRNLGFSAGMNVGIREALARKADRVLLVNSDVWVPPDAIAQLEATLETNAQAGIAGPVVVARSTPNRIASIGMTYTRSNGRMLHRGAGALVSAGRPPMDRIVDGVSGCLMLVKREVFEAAGVFDEDYFFSFEDLDFCLSARRAGFATMLASAATVYHEGSQSLDARSPRRLYYAARNHLLLARRAGTTSGTLASAVRTSSILALNLAHALRSGGGGLTARVAAVLIGARDYARGRWGPA